MKIKWKHWLINTWPCLAFNLTFTDFTFQLLSWSFCPWLQALPFWKHIQLLQLTLFHCIHWRIQMIVSTIWHFIQITSSDESDHFDIIYIKNAIHLVLKGLICFFSFCSLKHACCRSLPLFLHLCPQVLPGCVFKDLSWITSWRLQWLWRNLFITYVFTWPLSELEGNCI